MKNIVFFLILPLLFISCGSTETKSEEKVSVSENSSFALDLEKVDGGTFSFEEIRGKKHLVVAFWATWCEPCKQELKKIAEMYSDLSDSVEFVGVATDTEEMIDKVNEFVVETALPFPVLVDPNGNTVSSIIPGGDTVPYLIIVDKNGVVVSRHSGYNPGDEVALRKELDELSGR